MSPDRKLFIGPLIPLDGSEVQTAEGLQTGATHSGTILLDGHHLPCLYVPSFKQTMLAKSFFIRAGYTSSTSSKGKITYTHPHTHARFTFQLSDEDDLFHFVPNMLNYLSHLSVTKQRTPTYSRPRKQKGKFKAALSFCEAEYRALSDINIIDETVEVLSFTKELGIHLPTPISVDLLRT
jgi:hypothetical protein